MSSRRAALALLPLFLPAAAPACPNDRLLERVRGAARVQIEQLQGDTTRLETTLAHVPGRTLGYEVEGMFRITGALAGLVQAAIGRNDSYACRPDVPKATFEMESGLPIGFLFGTGTQAVAVVLHLPEGVVEMQTEGGDRSSGTLSQAGQRRWDEAVRRLAGASRATPAQFYAQMRPFGTGAR